MPQKYAALFPSRDVNLDSLLAGENHLETQMLITEQLSHDREMVNVVNGM